MRRHRHQGVCLGMRRTHGQKGKEEDFWKEKGYRDARLEVGTLFYWRFGCTMESEGQDHNEAHRRSNR